ncbi:MAG: SGNH/GDSL hydrolase family protein, partial [Candidatus Binatia bacterium]
MLRRFFSNLLLTLISIASVFLIGEVIARIFLPPPMQVLDWSRAEPSNGPPRDIAIRESHDPLYQYSPQGGVRLTPNARIRVIQHYLSHQDIDIRTNSLGFRGPEPAPDKGGEIRVLVLGDSITLGDYVAEGDTYPGRLEFYLRQSDPRYRVFNAGIGLADIRNELQILLESGLKTKPDLVLVGLYLNDGELSYNMVIKPLPGWLGRSYFAGFLNRTIQTLLFRWKHRHDLAGSGKAWLRNFTGGRDPKPKDWRTDREGFDHLIVKHARDWGAAWDPRTWEIVEEHLKAMGALAAEIRFKLVVALFPVRFQVEADYLYNAPQQRFQELMTR